MEVLEWLIEDKGLDFEVKGSDKGEYWVGPCPFHYHENNHTTFNYYPTTDKCLCWSCHPERMDAIGLWMLWKNLKFVDAVKSLGSKKDESEIYASKLQKELNKAQEIDYAYFVGRARQIRGHCEYNEYLQKINECYESLRNKDKNLALRALQINGH